MAIQWNTWCPLVYVWTYLRKLCNWENRDRISKFLHTFNVCYLPVYHLSEGFKMLGVFLELISAGTAFKRLRSCRCEF